MGIRTHKEAIEPQQYGSIAYYKPAPIGGPWQNEVRNLHACMPGSAARSLLKSGEFTLPSLIYIAQNMPNCFTVSQIIKMPVKKLARLIWKPNSLSTGLRACLD